MSKTFVYNGKEVVLTGRVARKSLRSGKIEELHEIRPSDIEGTSTKYNSWVKKSDLFEITNET